MQLAPYAAASKVRLCIGKAGNVRATAGSDYAGINPESRVVETLVVGDVGLRHRFNSPWETGLTTYPHYAADRENRRTQ
jgi:hypothetical protein